MRSVRLKLILHTRLISTWTSSWQTSVSRTRTSILTCSASRTASSGAAWSGMSSSLETRWTRSWYRTPPGKKLPGANSSQLKLFEGSCLFSSPCSNETLWNNVKHWTYLMFINHPVIISEQSIKQNHEFHAATSSEWLAGEKYYRIFWLVKIDLIWN